MMVDGHLLGLPMGLIVLKSAASSMSIWAWGPWWQDSFLTACTGVCIPLQTQTGCCNATVGDMYRFTFAYDTFYDLFGEQWYGIAVGGQGMPSWMHFDAPTRTITGIPPRPIPAGTTVSITAYDFQSRSLTSSYTLYIADNEAAVGIDVPLLEQTSCCTINIGVNYSFTIDPNTFYGLNGIITYTATGLPEWMQYNGSAGQFWGVATAPIGSYNIIVTATDENLTSVSDSYTLSIGEALFEVKFSERSLNEQNRYYTYLYSVAALSNGDVLAMGRATVDYGFIVRLTNAGLLVWNYAISGAATLTITDAIQCNNSDIVAVGTTSNDVFAMRLRLNGALVWKVMYGDSWYGDGAYSVVEVADGSVYVGGIQNSEAMLIKLNGTTGSKQWAKQFVVSGCSEIIQSLLVTRDGGFVAVSSCGATMLMYKLTSAGNVQWEKGYYCPGMTDLQMKDVIEISDGGYAMWIRWSARCCIVENKYSRLDSVVQILWNSSIQ